MIQTNIIGRLGKDAEVKTLQSGKKVISFSAAVDTGYGDNKKTLWVECSYFTDKTQVADFLIKGTQVYVSGEGGIRTWESNGKSGASFTLLVREVKLLGGNPKEQNQSTANNTQRTAAPAQQSNTNDSDLSF